MNKFIVFTCIALLSYLHNIEDKFYKALFGNNLEEINNTIALLEKQNDKINQAYLATLLMKKSNFLKTPAEKLKFFKKGCEQLENLIQKNPQNLEFRFLRITIQENAPKILKYDKDLNNDCKIVKDNFSRFKSSISKYILDYSKQSKFLNLNSSK